VSTSTILELTGSSIESFHGVLVENGDGHCKATRKPPAQVGRGSVRAGASGRGSTHDVALQTLEPAS
jgi:hypothetical protein